MWASFSKSRGSPASSNASSRILSKASSRSISPATPFAVEENWNLLGAVVKANDVDDDADDDNNNTRGDTAVVLNARTNTRLENRDNITSFGILG
jgi:hypothetical protein